MVICKKIIQDLFIVNIIHPQATRMPASNIQLLQKVKVLERNDNSKNWHVGVAIGNNVRILMRLSAILV